jgi:hypothetical protein
VVSCLHSSSRFPWSHESWFGVLCFFFTGTVFPSVQVSGTYSVTIDPEAEEPNDL